MNKAEIKKWLQEHGYENLVKEVQENISEKDAEQGFYISCLYCNENYPDGLEEVQTIDCLVGTGIPGFPANDDEAVSLAKAKGFTFIDDIPGVEKDRFLDNPHNRSLLSQKAFCVGFNIIGSIIIMADNADNARAIFIKRLQEKALDEDIGRILQEQLRHHNVNVDEVEEVS